MTNVSLISIFVVASNTLLIPLREIRRIDCVGFNLEWVVAVCVPPS